jgi:hypothetical protein
MMCYSGYWNLDNYPSYRKVEIGISDRCDPLGWGVFNRNSYYLKDGEIDSFKFGIYTNDQDYTDDGSNCK